MTFKQGDAVMVGPFDIVQFRDTHRPGPQDDGNTAILSRHESVGAMSADLCLLIPHSDALPAVARFLASHPDFVVNLGFVLSKARDVLDGVGPERDILALYEVFDFKKALTSGEGGAGGDDV